MSESTEYTKTLSFLNFGSFPGIICFSSGYSYDDLQAVLKKKRCTSWRKAAEPSEALMNQAKFCAIKQEMVEDRAEYQYYFLFLRDPFDFGDAHFCYLAHEVLHLCQFHLSSMLNRDREYEAEAYTHTHVMMQAIAALRTPATTRKEPKLAEVSDVFISKIQ